LLKSLQPLVTSREGTMAKKNTPEIQIYRISGNYVKNFQKFTFNKYARAVSEEAALDKVLSIITSARMLRRKINVTEIITVKPEECDDKFILALENI
jgi:ribosomal protein L20A (L18A)